MLRWCCLLYTSASERLESVEEGIDDDGLEEEHQQHDGNGSEPEVEPPAARAAANDAVENADEQRCV